MSSCPIPGCGAVPKQGHLMCLAHWRMVPKGKQMAVNRTWRDVRRNRDAYVDARQAAIDAVAAEISKNEQGMMF